MGGKTKAKQVAKREKKQQRRQTQERVGIVRQAFDFLPWTHPFWFNVLPYLSTRDKLSLRCVNTHTRGVIDADFKKAFTVTVKTGMSTTILPTFVGGNCCAQHLRAPEYQAAQEVINWLRNCAHSLVSVDLSFALFTNVKTSVETLVRNCKQLKSVSLRSLREDVHVSGHTLHPAAESPFIAFVFHPLPALEFLDIAGNGSAGMSPPIMDALLMRHPRLHTLYMDSGAVDARFYLPLMKMAMFDPQLMTEHLPVNRGLIRDQHDLEEVMDIWLQSSLKELILCRAGHGVSGKWLERSEWCWSPGCGDGDSCCWRAHHLGPNPVLVVLKCKKQSATEDGPAASSSFTPVITHTDCWHGFYPYTSLEPLEQQGICLKRSSCPAGQCNHLLSSMTDM